MKSSPNPTPHPATGCLIIAATFLIPLATGCASPGPPLPPSLHLPQPATDLTAQRIGDQIHLRWTTPSKTTDNVEIKDSTKDTITADICREAIPATITSTPPACISIQRLQVKPGPTQFTDTLPANLASNPATLLSYRVQLLNTKNRSAGPSPGAFAAAGTAPPAIDRLRATPAKTGIQLEWQPQPATTPAPAIVELTRQLITQPATTPKPPAPKPATTPKNTPKPTQTSKPLQLAPPTPTETKLQAGKQTTDPGGTLDTTAQKSETYTYTAQRVRTVILSGHTLELRSNLSAPITTVFRDIFPPAPPTGLEAVPGDATNNSIDLSWQPVDDANLAGYIVYRQEATPTGALTGPTTRFTATPIAAPAYRDTTAIPGHLYAYRVTAIDAAGNESAPSPDVQESLRTQ